MRTTILLLALAGPLLMAPGAAAPVTEAAQADLDRLLDLCKAGRLDGTFMEACFEHLEKEARTALPGDELWDGLRSDTKLRQPAFLAASQCGPKVFANLARLTERHPDMVKRFPALAVSFSAAWAHGDGPEPALSWVDGWLTEGRATPSFEESFADLAARAQDLRFPASGAPWQVLAHLADSIVPTAERAWAFDEYKARKTPGLRNLFGAVPYTLDPKRTGGPFTLQSFLECGGPCTHNVQFAGGVFDAFGIPSGWAGGPGHTYPYWFEMDGKTLRLFRTNEIGNRNGKIRDPLTGGHVWEDRLRLQVAALNHGQGAEARAALGAWAFRQLPKERRHEAAPILVAAVEANPFCHSALLAAAEATSKRQISPGSAGRIWKAAAQKMTEGHPEELGDLLDMAIPAFGSGPTTFDGDVPILARFEKRQGGRLATWRFGEWRARVLAARDKRPAARRVLLGAALELAPVSVTGFKELLDGLEQITEPGTERTKALRSLLEDIADPKDGYAAEAFRSRLWTAASLRRAYGGGPGGKAGNRVWVDELVAQQEARRAGQGEEKHRAGIGPVGGAGGASFEQQIGGAPLIGVRVTTTGFNGRTVIGSIQSIFAGPSVHDPAGGVRGNAIDLTIPDGWVLWGIVAAGSDRVDGLQIIATPGAAWRGKAHVSPWVGSSIENGQLLGGPKGLIEGLTGRAGADLDAMGVLLAPR